MSDKLQKLLGDLTVQYMMDVQELRDEVIKLKKENDSLTGTVEASEPAVQDSGALPFQSEASCCSSHLSDAGMSKEDIKLARLHRTLDECDPIRRLFEDDGEILAAEVDHCTRIANFLQSDAYELMVGLVILMNLLVIAAVIQVQGTALGYSLNYPGYSEPSRAGKEAREVFAGLDLLFLGLFTVDLILRASVLHIRFFKAPLNWVDFLVVISGLIEVFGDWFMDPFFLRMLRLAKFGRAFRAMRLSKVSHSLKLLGKCITASVGMLFWSLALVFVVQCIGGMMLSTLIGSFMENTEVDPQVRRLVFRYYGTFSGSMLTMFQVLFANWSISYRILVDHVSEWWSLWFIIYRCLVGFAMLNVVNACFVQQTMAVAQQDTELMIYAKGKEKNAYARKLHILFRELDTSGDGMVSWQEFEVLLTDDRLRSFLAAMEIDASDLKGLFDVLGDGSGNISADDFIAGARSLNGAAKAVDMAQLLSIVKRLDSKLESSASCSQQLIFQAELAVASRKSNNNNNNNRDINNTDASEGSYQAVLV
ncbi:unnamed protein product [Polarella glacialis]|uniref:EF-hand domain-containing protein n=1 Tax=Polarella glacialis TaxID=89957 RepID=A0A813FQW3_POLGL|nr:unnamed protein product [Polarella glacialis]CAE8615859.1 unnamed protein product [Polarella glacialis]CAE8711655.1 unnamed protein product [Polarella glacialis]